MDNSNIKVYLAISGALIVLLILIIIIPFSKKPLTTNNQSLITGSPLPTTVSTGSTYPLQPTPYNLNNIPADFTGVAEEELPAQVMDMALQKKDLRQKTPFDLTTFVIDFDYGQDKFTVSFKDPKDQAQKEFESWRTANYPALIREQFLLK